eukprot:TRINITY_DN51774_c0_g1_i1.p2 TRINITY_DN51774_c0_g1~~TRINITY_DN51774_c0_g1_i1.p2  ORF type:complete len:296 (+),score=123.94 TRINITY_DN51774_c0_g1_i1:105-890(+)
MTELHAPRYPWLHKVPLHYHLPGLVDNLPLTQWMQGHDWPSVRRGRQIYTEVFAPCHSMNMLSFRHLQEFMTIEEVKALAAEYEVVDQDPDMEGNEVRRPAGLLDKLPKPYKNSNEAKFSNGGAEPPDLSLMAKGRDGGENYLFSLLTAYGRDLPAGVSLPRDGLFWNPYFPGGFIAMPSPLSDGLVDYEDGTPATVSQMAKDVCCFLAWSAEPYMDEKKYWLCKLLFTSMFVIPTTFYWYKSRFNLVKLRRHKVLRLGYL